LAENWAFYELSPSASAKAILRQLNLEPTDLDMHPILRHIQQSGNTAGAKIRQGQGIETYDEKETGRTT
jgi:hypothetical protein